MAIDLRSDTVTRPDAEMRRAMAEAEVGDDVYGEDPTVAVLEEEAAAAVGQEAALFVPTGTMGNQIALHLHARPGCEVICDAAAHILHFEMGAMAALSGLLPKPLPSPDGLMDPAAVEAAVAPDIGYKSRTGLIAVENTHNLAGGTVYDRPHLEALLDVARRHRLPIHLDGARIFNAAIALGVPAAELGAGFDSVQFCLSKGLGAPVGSLICGSRPFVVEARRVRKMFGGGMRQVGVLAAAGLVALRKGPARLADDHANARLLAEALAGLPGIELDPTRVRTNIVVFGLTEGDAVGFLARLRDKGVLGVPVGPRTVRLVTHRDAPRERVEQAITRIREAVG
ncbi:MAG TPA: GntG family PLP-dependent aldolase [Thermoanaerobaculia bacterium]|nr:GntG family PLP-dependent aldolase [Thermoanaerobaculia bacterium]